MSAGQTVPRPHEKGIIVMKYTTRLPAVEFSDPLIRLRDEGVEGYPPGLNWITFGEDTEGVFQ